jgi:hypothetical protein
MVSDLPPVAEGSQEPCANAGSISTMRRMIDDTGT